MVGGCDERSTPAFPWLSSEVSRLIERVDWGRTPIGPPSGWPATLRNAAELMLASGFPMFIVWGPERLLLYNDAYAPILGERHPGAFARAFWDVWGEVREEIEPIIDAAFAGRSSLFEDLEVTLLRQGVRQHAWFTFSYTPIRSPEGDAPGALCVCIETTGTVTERRARDASRSKLEFLDKVGAAMAQQRNADAVLATVTRLTVEHLGLSDCAYADMDEDQDGFTIRGDHAAPGSPSIVGHYQLADFGKLAVEKLSQGEPLVINDNLQEIAPAEAATFQSIGISATVCMPLVKEGRLIALMAVHDNKPRYWTDDEIELVRELTSRSWEIVQRVGVEAELRDNLAQLDVALKIAKLGTFEWDLDTRGLTLDERSREMFGFTPDEPITGAQVLERIAPEDRPRLYAAVKEALAAGEALEVEFRISAPGVAPRDVVSASDAIMNAAGRPSRMVAVLRDVTQRRRDEVRLRELNESLERQVAEAVAERQLLTTIVEVSNDPVQVLDLEYRWLALNAACASDYQELYGRRPAIGDSLLDLLADSPEQLAKARALWGHALSGEAFTHVDDFGDTPGERRVYEMKFDVLKGPDGVQVGAFLMGRDITEREQQQARLREAQEALRQSQKMEAMGQLTGGVAHDFNNLLTPIIGALDRLQTRGVGDEREQRLIAGAMHSAERAKTLVQRLLAFARRQPLQPVAIDVRRLVTGMADLVASTTGPQVHVVVEAPEGLPPAKADPNQLEMAILNLSVNARDAMPDGGVLRISAHEEVVSRGHRAHLSPGAYVRLSVADTGFGMDADTLARAIEPFFSTKGIGKGTGLGLSMVHGLASQLGGALTINSQPSVGTNVELWLPVSEAPVERAESQRPAPQAAAKGTALLVDDEEMVRLTTADMLTDLGFEVIEASSAEAALKIVQEGRPFDLLITDHLMPGLTGAELARRLRAMRGDLPVLLVSGYTDGEGVDAELPRLTKPFRKDELEAMLAELAVRPAERLSDAGPAG